MQGKLQVEGHGKWRGKAAEMCELMQRIDHDDQGLLQNPVHVVIITPG
jgi:hypothetical protein